MSATRFVARIFLFLCLLPLAVFPAAAKTSAKDNYAVEVVVFANTGPDTSAGELWTGEHLPPNLSGAVEPRTIAGPNSPMNSVVDLLTASPDYRVLYHNRWVQTVGSKSATDPDHITNVQPATTTTSLPVSAYINGFIRLYRTRFMILNVDLAYRPANSDFVATGGYGSTESARGQTTYVIDQTRRIAKDEIHYFDHPKFGVLVYVTPAPKTRTKPANP
jgi:hypothetical protein